MVRLRSAALLIFTCWLTPVAAMAQGQLPPPAPPGPPWSPAPPTLPQTIQVPGPGQPAPPPGLPPPPPFDYAPPVVQLPGPQPVILRPQQKPGLFGAFEIGVVAPSIGGQLSAPVTVGGFTKTVSLPFADLDWTGTPRLELGYRFSDELGSFVAAYRSVVSEGGADLYGFDPLGPAFLKSRLNLNAVDLMYASPALTLDPLWDLRWDLGVRIAGVYYDTAATGAILSQSTSNNFVGAGPRVGVDVRRHLEAAPGLALFGRLETGVMFGTATQSFEEVISVGGVPVVGGATRFSDGTSVPMFGLQLGASYSPPQECGWLRFTFGYQFEQWWDVGGVGSSSGDVQFQGLFFRGEFRY